MYFLFVNKTCLYAFCSCVYKNVSTLYCTYKIPFKVKAGAECEKCVLEAGLPIPYVQLLKLKNVKSLVIFCASQMKEGEEIFRCEVIVVFINRS